ncbi:hypothetical protein HAX54_010116 [Datura stramonium]|uniref:Uncharacterized protein n=1 Tax=Datura stramonium TaxID=4076 RepID=A0ABS8THA9_DATST|nr:hypothetical protein [Datura stramonium]
MLAFGVAPVVFAGGGLKREVRRRFGGGGREREGVAAEGQRFYKLVHQSEHLQVAFPLLRQSEAFYIYSCPANRRPFYFTVAPPNGVFLLQVETLQCGTTSKQRLRHRLAKNTKLTSQSQRLAL